MSATSTPAKKKTISRKKKVAATAAALLTAGGAAFAYWTSIGSGAGSATTGKPESLTVNQTSSIAGLAPGADAQPLAGTFDNPNTTPITVNGVTATIAGVTTEDGDTTACATDNYLIGGTGTVTDPVPAGTAVGSWSGLTIQMVDTGDNQDVCKGATVQIAYTAN
jgi:hypothetical protein